MTFKRYNKYLVLKWEDVDKALGETNHRLLYDLAGMIDKHRTSLGKKPNSYIVVNEDEPYAEIVWKLVKAGEKLSHDDLERLLTNISVEF